MIKLINTKEAARILGCTPVHVRRLCRWGILDGEKVGRDWVISRSDALKLCRGKRQEVWL